MKIAIHGLGRMGLQLSRKLSDNGHSVVAHNRSKDKIDLAVRYGAQAAFAKTDVVAAFDGDPVWLWLMLPAEVVDSELDLWLSILPRGSTVIDGGNSDYRLTKIRAERTRAAGHRLVDVGVSGGIWGYNNGFCLMIGSDDRSAYQTLEPVFKSLAAPEGTYAYFGSAGAGHFVKMTHNAIEYGMMESLAEGYHLLKEGPYPDIDLARAGATWQHHSVITSWLNQLSTEVLQENPELEGITGYVAESGEARWSLETARELNLPLPAIAAAFAVRLRSQSGETSFATKLLAAMRNKFGGHALNRDKEK